MTDEEPTTTSDVIRRDRFSGGPARGFLSSLSDDERIFAADLAVDRAHVVMLAEQDIISPDAAGTILDALADIESAGFDALPDGEDVHAAIETAVVDHAGTAGRQMHTARSRNDEVSTCIRYRLSRDLLDLLTAVLGLRQMLIETAETHTETVMPGYTHLQPAQPTTVGHWLCSYESAFQRDTTRLFDAYTRVNRCPLGAAALAGTPFPVDRTRVAELLGFDGVIENAMDAAATRDFLLETVAATSVLATTVSGLAEDMVFIANRGFVALDDDYASTSSIMPQKKNPDTLELVRATAGDAAASLSGLTTMLKGLPRAYNRDLQKATPHLWAAVDAVAPATEVAGGAIRTATWNETALLEAAGEGFATATGVADQLTMAGIPFRTAHQLVATAAENGADYAALERAAQAHLEEPLEAVVDRQAIEQALDPRANVTMRDSHGGPAPSAVRDSLSRAREALALDDGQLTELQARLRQAADRLHEEVITYR